VAVGVPGVAVIVAVEVAEGTVAGVSGTAAGGAVAGAGGPAAAAVGVAEPGVGVVVAAGVDVAEGVGAWAASPGLACSPGLLGSSGPAWPGGAAQAASVRPSSRLMLAGPANDNNTAWRTNARRVSSRSCFARFRLVLALTENASARTTRDLAN
jgi:hypothetical protein